MTLESCKLYKDINATRCDLRLTQQTYHDFQTKYLDLFLSHILSEQHASCVMGTIQVAVHSYRLTPAQQKARTVTYRRGSSIITEYPPPIGYDWARLLSSDVDPASCGRVRRAVVPVLLRLGNYSGPRTSPVTQLRAEYDQNRRPSGARDSELWGGHYSVVLIDNVDKTIEYFEPNGSSAAWIEPVLPVLRRLLVEGGVPRFRNYRLIEPGEFCPRVSIQAISQTAMCAFWSSLYTLLRLGCPRVPRDKLVEDLAGRGRPFLLRLLQRWHCYMWAYSRRHKITGARQLLQATQRLLSRSRGRQDIPLRNALVRAYNQAFRLYHDEWQPERADTALRPARDAWVALGRDRAKVSAAVWRRARDLMVANKPREALRHLRSHRATSRPSSSSSAAARRPKRAQPKRRSRA